MSAMRTTMSLDVLICKSYLKNGNRTSIALQSIIHHLAIKISQLAHWANLQISFMQPLVLLLSGQIKAYRCKTVGHDLELYEDLIETNLASSTK